MTPLRQAMIDQCRLRGLSPRTEETYLYAVEQISRYYQQRPDYLTEAQLEAYFTYLTLEKKASRNTIHIQLNGIHFFFEHVLHHSFTITKPLPKRAHKLPTLLSAAEVRQIITCCEDPKYQTMLWVYYGTGLRLMELIHTKVKDVDGKRSVLKVEGGKGDKDRYVLLAPSVLELLRSYWQEYRPRNWLFYSRRGMDQPVSCSCIAKAFRAAAKLSGVGKACSVHSLRHAYATHQLTSGMPLHELQNQLGHSNLKTTQNYLHWLPEMGSGARDLLAHCTAP